MAGSLMRARERSNEYVIFRLSGYAESPYEIRTVLTYSLTKEDAQLLVNNWFGSGKVTTEVGIITWTWKRYRDNRLKCMSMEFTWTTVEGEHVVTKRTIDPKIAREALAKVRETWEL